MQIDDIKVKIKETFVLKKQQKKGGKIQLSRNTGYGLYNGWELILWVFNAYI